VKSKLIHKSTDEKTFVLVFDNGDEVMENLLGFIKTQDIGCARFTAIGAFSGATLGYYDWVQKEYTKNVINEQVEVLSLIGDVALKAGKPKVHAHVVLGKRDGTAHGGHLLEAHVRPTLEVMLTESPATLRRAFDPVSGLALIDVQGAERQ
jgi:predicted DNA-binding protein with PD1-like motif